MGKKSTSSSTTEEKEMTRWTGKNYSFSKFDRTVLNCLGVHEMERRARGCVVEGLVRG